VLEVPGLKLSKAAKARIKRMSASERKAMVKAAAMLADAELITGARYSAIIRTCGNMGRMGY
jgi:hypothetical protein